MHGYCCLDYFSHNYPPPRTRSHAYCVGGCSARVLQPQATVKNVARVAYERSSEYVLSKLTPDFAHDLKVISNSALRYVWKHCPFPLITSLRILVLVAGPLTGGMLPS